MIKKQELVDWVLALPNESDVVISEGDLVVMYKAAGESRTSSVSVGLEEPKVVCRVCEAEETGNEWGNNGRDRMCPDCADRQTFVHSYSLEVDVPGLTSDGEIPYVGPMTGDILRAHLELLLARSTDEELLANVGESYFEEEETPEKRATAKAKMVEFEKGRGR